MTDHLSPFILSALADGELSKDQLVMANEHLAGCPSCTAHALHNSLLKSAVGKAGQRYAPSFHLQERLMRLPSQETLNRKGAASPSATGSSSTSISRLGMLGWATAAVLVLAFIGAMFVQRDRYRTDLASGEHMALATEAFDQHLATLAGSSSPQVLSTDRHTVKPWFQGKIPFSFNLPENLPNDITLNGANLTYLHNHPVAQLLYSIGRHRVSVFVSEKSGAPAAIESLTEHSGFHVMYFGAGDLEMVAVSDVDPVRLAELVTAIRHAQTQDHTQPR